MSKTYTHLTLDDRITIQILLDAKFSVRAIARTLNRAPSTLTREFKRNGGLLPEPDPAPKLGKLCTTPTHPKVIRQYRHETTKPKPI